MDCVLGKDTGGQQNQSEERTQLARRDYKTEREELADTLRGSSALPHPPFPDRTISEQDSGPHLLLESGDGERNCAGRNGAERTGPNWEGAGLRPRSAGSVGSPSPGGTHRALA